MEMERGKCVFLLQINTHPKTQPFIYKDGKKKMFFLKNKLQISDEIGLPLKMETIILFLKIILVEEKG